MLSSVSGAQQNVTPLFYSCSHFTLGTFIKLTNIVCIVLRFTLFSLCVCVCVCVNSLLALCWAWTKNS